jgi:hypothetical protein
MSAERWRVGRKVGRTLYIHQGDDEVGEIIGLVDTRELAQRICAAMNARAQACPSCGHDVVLHQHDGCQHTVSSGRPGQNTLCPCGLTTPDQKKGAPPGSAG